MAVIKPFRGVRYNPDFFEQLDVVVSQPYDRIDGALQQRYHQLSPYNVTGIILANEDGSGYSGARSNYVNWLDNGVLVREDHPALYAYEQRFTVNRHEFIRLGMIAALELAEFEESIVLPHERTHSGPKADRLSLIQTLEVNTEQIFMLYPDPDNRVNALLRQAIDGREPDIDVVEMFEDQVRQRVWVITDPATINAIQTEMAPMRSLIIADGHHRYETALKYRRQQFEQHPTAINAAFNYASVTLVSMDDPGLVVLPTHREIHSFDARTPQEILTRAEAYFDVVQTTDLDTCLATINGRPDGHAFGLYSTDTGFNVLTLKHDGLIDELITDDRSPDWKSLAVSIAHRILLEQVAEVPAEGIDQKTMVRYHRDASAAVASIDAGNGSFVLFLSPTSMQQIKACAGHGEKMPQKSTDFYPKVISGLAMLPVGKDERLLDPGAGVPA